MSIQRQTPLSFSFYFFWMSFSPPSHLLSALFKMTTNVSVHTLQATDGYCSGDTRLRLGVMVVDFFFCSGVGGDISYLKDQGTVMEQPNPSLRRMAAGSLWKNRLALPPFLSPPPPPFFASSSSTPPTSQKKQKTKPLPLSHPLSNHFVYLSHLVCFLLSVSH